MVVAATLDAEAEKEIKEISGKVLEKKLIEDKSNDHRGKE
jgi:hypothetical protein